jgi:hypothetical protein
VPNFPKPGEYISGPGIFLSVLGMTAELSDRCNVFDLVDRYVRPHREVVGNPPKEYLNISAAAPNHRDKTHLAVVGAGRY